MTEHREFGTLPDQQQSEAVADLIGALAKAQGLMHSPRRNRSVQVQMKAGGKYNFRYATLAEINDMAREPMAANNLAIVHQVQATPAPGQLCTRLLHASGQWLSSTLLLRPIDQLPQSLGSAITYCKRYNVMALLNIAGDEDDDGAAAAGNHSRPIEPPSRELPELTPEQALKQRFGRLLQAARNIEGDPRQGLHLLKLWQADMDEFCELRHDPQRNQAWNALTTELPAALAKLFVSPIPELWTRALMASSIDDMKAVRVEWQKASEITEELQRRQPEAFGLITEHLRAQWERVEALEPEEPEEPEPERFEARLMDEFGEWLNEEVFTAPVACAKAYHILWQSSDDRDNLAQHNSETLAKLQRYPLAATILTTLVDAETPQTIDAIALHRDTAGMPRLTDYLNAVREQLGGLRAREDLNRWIEVNSPIYEGLAHGARLQVLKMVAERAKMLGAS